MYIHIYIYTYVNILPYHLYLSSAVIGNDFNPIASGSPRGRFFSTAGMQDPLLRPRSELQLVVGSVAGLCFEVEYFGQLPETMHFCHVFSGCRCLDLDNIVLVLIHVTYHLSSL